MGRKAIKGEFHQHFIWIPLQSFNKIGSTYLVKSLAISAGKCHLLVPDNIHTLKHYLKTKEKKYFNLVSRDSYLSRLLVKNNAKTKLFTPPSLPLLTWIHPLRNLVRCLQFFRKKQIERFQFRKLEFIKLELKIRLQKDIPRLSRRRRKNCRIWKAVWWDGISRHCSFLWRVRIKIMCLCCKTANILSDYLLGQNILA